MLASKHISQLHDFINPETVFPDTNNRGGVCYFLIDKVVRNHSEGQTRIVTHSKEGKDIISVRPLNSLSLGLFIRDSIGVEIAEKLISNESFYSLSNEISSRKPFGYDGKIIESTQFHKEPSKLREPIVCYGKAQIKGYVERAAIPCHQEWIDCCKVFVPRANNISTELNDDNQNVFVGLPKEVCSETYILAGAQMSLTKETANFLAKCMKTKFARFMHGLIKVSQDASKQTYRFVPVPDLSKDSPINWNLSLDEIDEQLFAFYDLTEEEKQHISSYIKDMLV